MTPDVVVDVGNTRIKWGVVQPDGRLATHPVPTHSPTDWEAAIRGHHPGRRLAWLVAGVQPDAQARFVAWARERGDEVTEVTSYRQLPIAVEVEPPDTVGLDRLLGAVAANRLRTPGRVAVTVDVGTAVTVNMIDANGAFAGGMILPGVWLMARSLQQNTAKLPLIDGDDFRFPNHSFPGKSTPHALRTGISYAIAGAVRLALAHATTGDESPELFQTGGGAASIRELLLDCKGTEVPTLVLDGLVITAEALP
jgi:type III pantothenate kinase